MDMMESPKDVMERNARAVLEPTMVNLRKVVENVEHSAHDLKGYIPFFEYNSSIGK